MFTELIVKYCYTPEEIVKLKPITGTCHYFSFLFKKLNYYPILIICVSRKLLYASFDGVTLRLPNDLIVPGCLPVNLFLLKIKECNFFNSKTKFTIICFIKVHTLCVLYLCLII